MIQFLKARLRPLWIPIRRQFRQGKRHLWNVRRHLPTGDPRPNPPRHLASLQAWTARASAASFYVREAFAAHTLHRDPPRTQESVVHWKFKDEYVRASPAAQVLALAHGRFWANPGGVTNCVATITPDDCLVEDFSLEYGARGRQMRIFQAWKLDQPHFLPGRVAVLTAAKANIYFHWITDLLPRLAILQAAGYDLRSIDYFVVNSQEAAFQRESLAKLGIPNQKIVESQRYPHVQAEQLLVPSLPGVPGNPTDWSADFLRRHLPENTSMPTPDRRLYVSRRTAQYRRVRNETAVENLLKAHGFEVVLPDRLSLQEQIETFRSAQCIVAPHGAALTNLLFCQPDTHVLEFFAPTYVNACYYATCQLLGLSYTYLIGEGPRPPEGKDPHQAGEDITVPLPGLAAWLAQVSA